MSIYDAWIASEKAKIHKEFEQKRKEVLEKSLLDGFDNAGKKAERGQLSADYERLVVEETAAIAELMKSIEE